VTAPIARITASDGSSGFGWSRVTREGAQELVGCALREAVGAERGVSERFRDLEFPLWDLLGKRAGKPVYALLGGPYVPGQPFRAPVYDTSLYMDDLEIADDAQAAEAIAMEALEGAARGHRAFKIKVGRGAMHMSLEAGTRRDIRVVRRVREAVGAQAKIMLDANNGYNLNLTKRVLAETASVGIHWIEEAFHEDARLYSHLKDWLASRGLGVLVADGEGDASPRLLEWARAGLIDVVQYDIRRPGFTHWLSLGPRLDAWGVSSAPHHYGGAHGNYSACHLAARIQRFALAEWDEVTIPGLDASAYRISEGCASVPGLPGFGLGLDEAIYSRAVRQHGFAVSDRG
jgi:L-alanine-DL-glutamate epimerase-like enolase superfamily enzyme